MSDYNDYARLLHQMQSFRASDEAREQFVSEILAKYQALAEEHTNLKNDYLSERDIRRNYQRTVDEKQALVGDHERQLQASSFVLALIDGDGAIFQDALLQAAGGDGGSEAASRLYHAIRAHVASLYNNSANWHIMVQIYLSLDKLAMKLASIGLLRSPQEFRAFAQSFNVNQPLFSIIDVGQGKERADHKIKEMLRTFSDNPTCRHIIFGGCHDAGYLVNLEKFKHDMVKASQITLLETTPAYRGFNDLINFKRTRFDDVFKNEPLPDYVPPSNEFNQLAVQSPVPLAVQPPNRSNSNNNNASPTMISRLITSPSPSVTPLSSVTPAESSKDSSWATVGKASAPTNGSISIAPTTTATTKKSKKKYAYYNKAEQRLDEPLPPKDPAAAASLEMRMKKSGKKMCNHWHLGGYCENGSFCTFQHEPKLTPGELNALRYKTRSLACKNRYCDNIDCYLGHQCALERDQGWCPYPENCHLRATHGMDRVRYVRYDKDGNADYAP